MIIQLHNAASLIGRIPANANRFPGIGQGAKEISKPLNKLLVVLHRVFNVLPDARISLGYNVVNSTDHKVEGGIIFPVK